MTLVGFMANNCILASAAWGETIGLTTEVLSDAVGAINLRNRAGRANARTVHATMMALLHRSLQKKPAEEWSEEDRALMETYGKQADFVDFVSLRLIINEMQRDTE